MYVNFLSTYSDKKSCHTSITLQASTDRFVSDSWASCYVLPRDAMHKRGLIAVMSCPSVCLPVCLSRSYIHSVKTNKHMFEFFSPSGSHTIWVYRSHTDTKHRAASLRQQSFLFALAVRITGKLLKIDAYMLRWVWQTLNCLFIYATFCVIATGASPGQTKNEGWGT